MQVRHIEQQLLDLEKAEKARLDQPSLVQEEKPWEEVLECVAVLAAIHMQPCQTAAKKREDEDKQDQDDEDNSKKA